MVEEVPAEEEVVEEATDLFGDEKEDEVQDDIDNISTSLKKTTIRKKRATSAL